MGESPPGLVCKTRLGNDWIDEGTHCLTRSSSPQPTGQSLGSGEDLSQGAAWRVVYLLEYGGTYRTIYAAKAAELAKLKGQQPKSELEHLRGQLKSNFQNKTPPEIEKLLRAVVAEKYDLRTPTGSFNPGKTNQAINQVAKASKYAGRVFVVVMLASELYKIHTADDWRRQLGASSSGLLGAVAGGWLGGAATGFATGVRAGPWVAAGGTLIGGILGGALGYEVFYGFFEAIYDVYLVE